MFLPFAEEAERVDADDVVGGGHPGRAVGAHLVAGAGALQRAAPLQPLQGRARQDQPRARHQRAEGQVRREAGRRHQVSFNTHPRFRESHLLLFVQMMSLHAT